MVMDKVWWEWKMADDGEGCKMYICFSSRLVFFCFGGAFLWV